MLLTGIELHSDDEREYLILCPRERNHLYPIIIRKPVNEEVSHVEGRFDDKVVVIYCETWRRKFQEIGCRISFSFFSSFFFSDSAG